jgi:hypothetical protein
VALAWAVYGAWAHTVRLTPRENLVLDPPSPLRIIAAGLTDVLGRPPDGNRDGQPGGDFVATLGKRGISVARLR